MHSVAPSPVRSSKVVSSNSKSHQDSMASLTKRLTSELMTMMMSCPQGITAFPTSDSDLTYWKGRIEGAEGTVYAGQTYAISLRFPTDYPYKPPVVMFETPCFHPNVDLPSGHICLDILKEKWSPMLSVSTILISLQSLLGEPNTDSPLNTEAARLWDDQKTFENKLRQHYVPIPEDED